MSDSVEIAEIILDELLDDLEREISLDASENFRFYRPDARRRVLKFFRDYDNMVTYGDDTRGKTF